MRRLSARGSSRAGPGGGKGWYVEDPKYLRAALDEAMDFSGPALVNVKLHHEATRKPQEFRWLTT